MPAGRQIQAEAGKGDSKSEAAEICEREGRGVPVPPPSWVTLLVRRLPQLVRGKREDPIRIEYRSSPEPLCTQRDKCLFAKPFNVNEPL